MITQNMKIFIAVLFCLTIILFFNLTIYAQVEDGKIHCVCIDPGHGGNDPGSVGMKNYEKNVVLDVALLVGKLIKEQNPEIKVVFTREKDVFVGLQERGDIANQHKADVFISIHTNSFTDKKIKGIETYIIGTGGGEEGLRVAMKENAVIQYEENYSSKYSGFDPKKPESYVIFSLMQNMYRDRSIDLAELIQNELINETKRYNRGIREAGYLVLKAAAMPGVLVELPFISNVEEEKYLASRNGQEKMAQAIAGAFGKYKKIIERNSHVIKQKAITETVENEEQDLISQPTADFFYAIQVVSAVEPLQKKPKIAGEDANEIKSGGRYRYYVSACDSYKQVSLNLKKIKKIVDDCFIIAVKEGELISVGEAKKIEAKK